MAAKVAAPASSKSGAGDGPASQAAEQKEQASHRRERGECEANPPEELGCYIGSRIPKESPRPLANAALKNRPTASRKIPTASLETAPERPSRTRVKGEAPLRAALPLPEERFFVVFFGARLPVATP